MKPISCQEENGDLGKVFEPSSPTVSCSVSLSPKPEELTSSKFEHSHQLYQLEALCSQPITNDGVVLAIADGQSGSEIQGLLA